MISLPPLQSSTEYDPRYGIPVSTARMSSDSYRQHGHTLSDDSQCHSECDKDDSSHSAEPHVDGGADQQNRLLFADAGTLVCS